MKYPLLIATAVFVLSFGVVYAASPSAPLTVTVTPNGNPGPLPGSILPPCPGGCTWSLGFHDEFDGNGSAGNLATDGINWTTWAIAYGEGGTAYSVTGTAGAVIEDCTDAAFESGGYLHLSPIGSVSVSSGTSSNPAKGCEIETNITYGPGFYEAYVNYTNAAGWDDIDWFCCTGNNGDPSFEADVFETPGGIQKAVIFWDSYASQQQIWTAGSFLTGWHEIGIDFEKNSGVTFYVDGSNKGGANPDGCAAATPCTKTGPIRNFMYTSNPAFNNSTGLLVDWIRQWTHP